MARFESYMRDVVVKAIVAKVLARLIELTPIDKGAAREGWVALLNTDTATIENWIVYIVELDEGSSKQAPEGMTPTVFSEIQILVDAAISEL